MNNITKSIITIATIFTASLTINSKANAAPFNQYESEVAGIIVFDLKFGKTEYKKNDVVFPTPSVDVDRSFVNTETLSSYSIRNIFEANPPVKEKTELNYNASNSLKGLLKETSTFIKYSDSYEKLELIASEPNPEKKDVKTEFEINEDLNDQGLYLSMDNIVKNSRFEVN